MYTHILALAFLTASALGADFYTPVHDFGAMLKRGDALLKRQGYYPTTHLCGKGSTCAEACGPTQIQCPSDYGLYCYDPAVGDHCCTDGTGNSCSKGYYCTTDGAANTYCCPDGMDTGSCAAAYSLTVSLIRESSTAVVPTSVGSTAVPAFTPVTTTPIHVSFPTASGTVYPGGNASYTTSAPPPEFTGAATRVGGGVLAVLVGAAGL
ncbi:hypothetical protein K505DRAFT_201982, partial [Melanomma pulvis-pyrius CBS 109.77]